MNESLVTNREPGNLGEENAPPPPRYVQVRQRLMRSLASGEWRAGDLIPSEARLAELFGVAPGTVRKAIDKMVQQNLLVRRQGKGTFVSSHDHKRALHHFFSLVGNDGLWLLPSVEVLDFKEGAAQREEAQRLALSRNDRVFRIQRRRFHDNQPYILERIVLPKKLFTGLQMPPGTAAPQLLYEFYEKEFGITITSATEELRAVNATAEQAALLGTEAGTALLKINRLAFGFERTPVEWRTSLCETSSHYYLAYKS